MSWRLIFFINLPVAAVVVAISARPVPESRDPSLAGRLDVAGAALVTLGLVGVVFGLIEGPGTGWGAPRTVASLVGGGALLAAFVVAEAPQKPPMLPLSVFRSKQFSAANAATLVV